MTGFHSLPSLKRLRTPKASSKEISIQMITLIGVSRLIAMEANYESKKKGTTK